LYVRVERSRPAVVFQTRWERTLCARHASFRPTLFSDKPIRWEPGHRDSGCPGHPREEMARLPGDHRGRDGFRLACCRPGAHFRLRSYTPAAKVVFSGTRAGRGLRARQARPPESGGAVTIIREELEIGCLPVEIHVAANPHPRGVVITTEPAAFRRRSWTTCGTWQARCRSAPAPILPDFPCQVVSTGIPTLIVPLRSLESVRDIIPQIPGLIRCVPTRCPSALLAFSFETLKQDVLASRPAGLPRCWAWTKTRPPAAATARWAPTWCGIRPQVTGRSTESSANRATKSARPSAIRRGDRLVHQHDEGCG